MDKIAFIIPYFGKFNDYFPLWLESCRYNSDVADFFVISDTFYDKTLPPNVYFIDYTWENFKKYIQSFYDFQINLDSPYLICDYRPAYGEIFNNYIQNYSHWAFGDNDLIWGKWKNFLPHNWQSYDKLGDFGHLTIIKNTPEMNHLYRYKNVFQKVFQDNHNLFFDESGFKIIIEIHNKKTYSFKIADINPRKRQLSPINPLDYPSSGVFIWEKGNLFHICEINKAIQLEPVMYIHFLKRKMLVDNNIKSGDSFFIHDINIEKLYDDSNDKLRHYIRMFSKNKFYKEYWKKYLSLNQLKKSIYARINPISKKIHELENLILS